MDKLMNAANSIEVSNIVYKGRINLLARNAFTELICIICKDTSYNYIGERTGVSPAHISRLTRGLCDFTHLEVLESLVHYSGEPSYYEQLNKIIKYNESLINCSNASLEEIKQISL